MKTKNSKRHNLVKMSAKKACKTKQHFDSKQQANTVVTRLINEGSASMTSYQCVCGKWCVGHKINRKRNSRNR